MPSPSRRRVLAALAGGAISALLPGPGRALGRVGAFEQGVAEAAAGDPVLAAFYRGRGFAALWAGTDAAAPARRNALLSAMAEAPVHGLPPARHDPAALVRAIEAARTPHDQGRAEVELSRAFLRLSRDLGAGLLAPADADPMIKREVRAPDPLGLITAFPDEEPTAFLRSLAPAGPEYARLLRQKLRLEARLAGGGWGGPLPPGPLDPGQSGGAVVALRDRLVEGGFLAPTVSATYDDAMVEGVRRAQAASGLSPDGVAGEGTIAALGATPLDHLRSVLVALERERWNAAPRGARHVWVNLADFTAEIVDDDRVTFRTRAVIGSGEPDRQSPEFSDLMEFMVINPSWYVPRSIIMNEYLPQLRGDRNAAGHLRILDSRGREVSRGSIDLDGSFPYSMTQPPGPRNALGVVKFMLPNPWNIYLHDTPSRDLFDREVRAFSHGCIRLKDPRDFAYHLLARQTGDPEGLFQSRLATGAETRVDLDRPVPVHIDYRTAFTDARGELRTRRDVYGRDARVWAALAARGVEAGTASG